MDQQVPLSGAEPTRHRPRPRTNSGSSSSTTDHSQSRVPHTPSQPESQSSEAFFATPDSSTTLSAPRPPRSSQSQGDSNDCSEEMALSASDQRVPYTPVSSTQGSIGGEPASASGASVEQAIDIDTSAELRRIPEPHTASNDSLVLLDASANSAERSRPPRYRRRRHLDGVSIDLTGDSQEQDQAIVISDGSD